MQGRYEKLSAQEIREIFLNNTLDADLMSLNEYEKLFGYEMNLDGPNADILVFCTKGLNQHEKYSRDIQKPPFEAIVKKREKKKRQIRKSSASKAFQRVAAALMITVVLTFFAQIVAMALGFDLFGYVYNWLFDDAIEITTIEEDENNIFWFPVSDETNGENEVVFLDFERIEDIDEIWLSRVSPCLIDKYELLIATYYRFHDEEKFEIHFWDEYMMPISIVIQNRPMYYIEREEEGYVKEIIENNIIFKIFNNRF
jgi:hypothetical protein